MTYEEYKLRKYNLLEEIYRTKYRIEMYKVTIDELKTVDMVHHYADDLFMYETLMKQLVHLKSLPIEREGIG